MNCSGLIRPLRLRLAPPRQSRRVLLGMLVIFGLVSLSLEAADDNPYSIVNSKHNLAISGPGTVRAANEADICVFCHAPHTKGPQIPLWNHEMAVTAYTPYRSSTLKATVGQPTGSSKLCLSCHDGTVALGMVANRRTPITMRNGAVTMPEGASRLGTDLSGHHPVSFTYDSALAAAQGELRDPMTLPKEVKLDQNQQLQCTSCHDPHNDQFGQFLVRDNTASGLCLECHNPAQWTTSPHALSQATWNGSGRNPWPHTKAATVAANGCENCHAPHNAGTKAHLLNFAKAEDNCLICHNGTVAKKNIASEFNKASAHPITGLSAARDAALGPIDAIDQHVSCVDCHDPHTGRSPGAGPAAAVNVKGISASGALVKSASHEYELCFRCHANNSALAASKMARQLPQPNIRVQFNPANASYHPVLGPSKSALDRTLISPWTSASQMTCTDCHNSDQGPGAKGSGANGPHGSRYAPLLERNLVRMDFQSESPNAYALCYKCHNEGILMADRLHSTHVRDQKTACTTCHDAHGVQNQKHLINFNTLYVSPLNGRIDYTDLGPGRGTCTLTCHGANHDKKSF